MSGQPNGDGSKKPPIQVVFEATLASVGILAVARVQQRLRGRLIAALKRFPRLPAWVNSAASTVPMIEYIAAGGGGLTFLVTVELAKQSWLLPTVMWSFLAAFVACTGHWLRDYYRVVNPERVTPSIVISGILAFVCLMAASYSPVKRIRPMLQVAGVSPSPSATARKAPQSKPTTRTTPTLIVRESAPQTPTSKPSVPSPITPPRRQTITTPKPPTNSQNSVTPHSGFTAVLIHGGKPTKLTTTASAPTPTPCLSERTQIEASVLGSSSIDLTKDAFALINPQAPEVRHFRYVVFNRKEGDENRIYSLPPSVFVTHNEDDLLPGYGYRGDLAEVLGFNNGAPLSQIYLYYVYENNDGRVVEGENAWQFASNPTPHWGGLDVTAAAEHDRLKHFAQDFLGLAHLEAEYCGRP